MHVVHLVVDNLLLVSSPEKTISPSLSIPHLSVVLCIRWRPSGIYPIHFAHPLVLSLFSSHCGTQVGENLCVQLLFNLYEEIDSHRKLYDLLSYDLFSPSSAMFLMPEVWRYLCMCPLGLSIQLCVLINCGFIQWSISIVKNIFFDEW